MTIGLLFWILMVIWAVFGLYRGYTTQQSPPYWPFAGDLVLYILLLLLGIQAFGWPIKG